MDKWPYNFAHEKNPRNVEVTLKHACSTKQKEKGEKIYLARVDEGGKGVSSREIVKSRIFFREAE